MPLRRQPREIWKDTRVRVLQRDEYCCVRCGCSVTIETAHIDHIVSGKKGNNHISSLRTLCVTCHALRADHRHEGLRGKALAKGLIPPNYRELLWEG